MSGQIKLSLRCRWQWIHYYSWTGKRRLLFPLLLCVGESIVSSDDKIIIKWLNRISSEALRTLMEGERFSVLLCVSRVIVLCFQGHFGKQQTIVVYSVSFFSTLGTDSETIKQDKEPRAIFWHHCEFPLACLKKITCFKHRWFERMCKDVFTPGSSGKKSQ